MLAAHHEKVVSNVVYVVSNRAQKVRRTTIDRDIGNMLYYVCEQKLDS